MKIIIWIFYFIGIAIVGTTLHEMYHFYHCSGEFVTGFSYIRGQWEFGVTWCQNISYEGEIVPTTLEGLFYLLMIWLKIRYDKKV